MGTAEVVAQLFGHPLAFSVFGPTLLPRVTFFMEL